VDVLVWILGLEEEQLSDDQVRHLVLNLADDEDYAFLEQARIDVVSAFARAVCSTTIGTRFNDLVSIRPPT
jgi:hypothetical protein